MAMSAPFYKLAPFGDEASLIVGFLIGIGFGFFLERAGFGSAKKLVSQFYLTDLAVFKVMFTAIVTAMLGVTYLSWAGFLDLSLVYLVPTYWVAQVVGGLLLGGRLRGRRLLPRHVDRRDGHRQARRARLRPRLRRGDARLCPRLPPREGALHRGRPRHEDPCSRASTPGRTRCSSPSCPRTRRPRSKARFERAVQVAKFFGGQPRAAAAPGSEPLALPLQAAAPAVTPPTLPPGAAGGPKKKREGC
jgi:hypothetical protein